MCKTSVSPYCNMRLLRILPLFQPPSWFIKAFKMLLLISVVSVIVSKIYVDRVKVERKKPLRIAIPVTMLEYVEKKSLCGTVGLSPVNNSANYTAVRMAAACKKLREHEEAYYTPRPDTINPFIFDYVIPGKDICDSATDVVIAVNSNFENQHKRNSIRRTWGGAAMNHSWPKHTIKHNVRVIFTFGRYGNKYVDDQILDEDKITHDIVQGDFERDEISATLMALKWSTDNCRNIKYFIKSSDHVFINVPKLLSVLDSTNMTWGTMGHVISHIVVNPPDYTDLMPKRIFPFYYYPPFLSGLAYVINSDLLEPIYQAAESMPLVPKEDAFITGVLGRVLHANQHHNDLFTDNRQEVVGGCDVVHNRVITGKVKDTAADIWTTLTTTSADDCL